jgi:hypothetical protein
MEQYDTWINERSLGSIHNSDMSYYDWRIMIDTNLNDTDGIILFYKWRLFIWKNSSIESYKAWCLQHDVKFTYKVPCIRNLKKSMPKMIISKKHYISTLAYVNGYIYRIVFKAKKTIENYFCEIYYNPKYLFCRKRLIKEFESM